MHGITTENRQYKDAHVLPAYVIQALHLNDSTNHCTPRTVESLCELVLGLLLWYCVEKSQRVRMDESSKEQWGGTICGVYLTFL